MNLAVLSYFVYLFTSLSDYIKLRTRHFLKIQLYFDFQSDQVKKVIKLANFLPEAFDYFFFDGCIYNEKKKTGPPGYYQFGNGLTVTHALGHRMAVYSLLVPVSQRVLDK